MSAAEVMKLINDLHVNADTRGVAHKLLTLLLKAEDFGALNGLMLATAAYVSTPGIEKDAAKQFYEMMAAQIVRNLHQDFAQFEEFHAEVRAVIDLQDVHRCRYCGCHQMDACYDDERGPCGWATEDICSHCESSLAAITMVTDEDAEEGEKVSVAIEDLRQLQKIIHNLSIAPVPLEALQNVRLGCDREEHF